MRTFLLAGLLVVVACSTTETDTLAPSSGNGGADAGAATDAGAHDAGTDGATHGGPQDAGTDAADAAAESCAVEQHCTNNGTPNVPPEISGVLSSTCAEASPGADLQEKCTAFCKAGNPSYAAMTTCTVGAESTFQCRCVNP